MLRRILILVCGVALFAANVQADHHEEGGEGRRHGPPPFPHLMVPLPPDAEIPPPEDGPEAFVEAAIAALDRNGNGALDAEEILGAMKKMRKHMKEHREHDGEGEGCGGCGGDHEGHDHEGEGEGEGEGGGCGGEDHEDHDHDDDGGEE
jgi:hypothetical protein